MNRTEVVTSIRETILSHSLQSIQEALSKRFYNMNKVIEALYLGTTTGKNVILYGPGGFGKSQIVKAFLDYVSIPAPTIVGYEDMEVEALLGIPNIKKLTETSVYETAFDRSVFSSPGVLILEEFLDARPSTAAALKDILTEGGLRQNGRFTESLISSVIICTNKSPEDVSIDDSSAAFYKERFPIRIKVMWDHYSHEAYLDFLKVVKPDQVDAQSLLYDVLAETAARTIDLVSPRVIKDASDLLDVHKDIRVLQYVDGLDTADMTEVLMYCSFVTERFRIKAVLDRANKWADNLESKPLTTIRAITSALAEINFIVSKLTEVTSKHQENTTEILTFINRCSTLEHSLRYRIVGELGCEVESQLFFIINGESSS